MKAPKLTQQYFKVAENASWVGGMEGGYIEWKATTDGLFESYEFVKLWVRGSFIQLMDVQVRVETFKVTRHFGCLCLHILAN